MNQLLLSAPLLAGVLTITGCGTLAKVDRSRWYSRDGWSLPESVIRSLAITPGMTVADIGAGDGYFTFRFAEAVGCDGRVYAVELNENQLAKLRRRAADLGYPHVTAVHGEAGSPNLPGGTIDVAFFSGVFHHIDDPAGYFAALKHTLSPAGRVAIIDGAPDPLHAVFMPFHFASAEHIVRILEEASFERVQTFDLLPTMNFQVFTPRP